MNSANHGLKVDVRVRSAKSANFHIPVPQLVKREHMMREMVQRKGIMEGQWHSSRLYREWVRATETSDANNGEMPSTHEDKLKTEVHPNGNLTIFLDPEIDCAGSNHMQSFKWKPWLSKCIRHYYNTGVIKIPNSSVGNEILIALEYLEIVYTLDQFAFDSFGTHLRVKLWSDYYNHRAEMREWVAETLLEAPAKNSHTFVTSPTGISSNDDIFVGPDRGQLLEGGLRLHPEKYSGLPSCAVVHNFFYSDQHGESTSATKTAPLDELVRKDFAAYLQSSLRGITAIFTARDDIKIAGKSDMYRCAVLQIDILLDQVDNGSDEKSIEVSLYTTESHPQRKEVIYGQQKQLESEFDAPRPRIGIQHNLAGMNYDDMERARIEEERMDNIIYSVMQSSLDNTYPNDKNNSILKWANPKRRRKAGKMRPISEDHIVNELKIGSSVPLPMNQRRQDKPKSLDYNARGYNSPTNVREEFINVKNTLGLYENPIPTEISQEVDAISVKSGVTSKCEKSPVEEVNNESVQESRGTTHLSEKDRYSHSELADYELVSVGASICVESKNSFLDSKNSIIETSSSREEEKLVDGGEGKMETTIKKRTLERNNTFTGDDTSIALSTLFGDLPSIPCVLGESKAHVERTTQRSEYSARSDEALQGKNRDKEIIDRIEKNIGSENGTTNYDWFGRGLNLNQFIYNDPVLDDAEDEYLNLARRAMTNDSKQAVGSTLKKTRTAPHMDEGKILGGMVSGFVDSTNYSAFTTGAFTKGTQCLDLQKNDSIVRALPEQQTENSIIGINNSSSSYSSDLSQNVGYKNRNHKNKKSSPPARKRLVKFAGDANSLCSGMSSRRQPDEDTYESAYANTYGSRTTGSYSSQESDSQDNPTRRRGGNNNSSSSSNKTNKKSTFAGIPLLSNRQNNSNNNNQKRRTQNNDQSDNSSNNGSSSSSSSSSNTKGLNPIRAETSSSDYDDSLFMMSSSRDGDSIATEEAIQSDEGASPLMKSTRNRFKRILTLRRQRRNKRGYEI